MLSLEGIVMVDGVVVVVVTRVYAVEDEEGCSMQNLDSGAVFGRHHV